MTQFIKCITIEKKYRVLSKGPVFIGRVNLSIEFNKTRTVSRLNRYANTQLSLPILNIEALHNAIAFELWSACFHLFHCSRFHLTRNNVIALSLVQRITALGYSSPLVQRDNVFPKLYSGYNRQPSIIMYLYRSYSIVSMILWTNITREMHAKKSKKKKKKFFQVFIFIKK